MPRLRQWSSNHVCHHVTFGVFPRLLIDFRRLSRGSAQPGLDHGSAPVRPGSPVTRQYDKVVHPLGEADSSLRQPLFPVSCIGTPSMQTFSSKTPDSVIRSCRVFGHLMRHCDAPRASLEMQGPSPIRPNGLTALPSKLPEFCILSVASTVLVRGERTLLVEPANHHICAYVILWHALQSRGLDYGDIDMVDTAPCRTDHAAAFVHHSRKPWVLGAGGLDNMAGIQV